MPGDNTTSARLAGLQDAKHLKEVDSNILWHPYTQMTEYAQQDPIIVQRGEGPYLIDIRHRRFLDAFGSMWCNVWGHSNAEIAQAIKDQADQLCHTSLFTVSHVPAVQLAEQLVKTVANDFRYADKPSSLNHVFFSDNGSTAVEVAMKMALQYQNQKGKIQRTKFLTFHDSYHGDTFGTMSASNIDIFRRKFAPSLFDCYSTDYPMQVDPHERPDNWRQCDRNLEALIAGRSDKLAAVVVEPVVQGVSGMRPLAEDYLARIKKHCAEYDILLITDEVFVGFCRTGPIVASSAELVEPDIICLGKGITGGTQPMGVTMASDKVYAAFDGEWSDFKHFLHGHTYSGNPIACAAALANLEMIKNHRLKENVKNRARDFRSLLRQKVAIHPRVGEIRQRGLAIGIPILDENGNEPDSYDARKDANAVCKAALEKRVIVRPLGNIITIIPPLALERKHVEEIVNAIAEGLKVLDQTE